jgi:hypothetical protein
VNVHVVQRAEPARASVHVVQRADGGHSSESSGRCPPGHVWSDGKCHSTGKGHDPKHH